MTKHILVAVTSQAYYTSNNVPTGLWLSELAHFYDVLEPLGYTIEIVSTQGGNVPLEPKSLTGAFLDRATKRRYEDKAFMSKLTQTRSSQKVHWEDYCAIYYTGGHGAMWDFLSDTGFQEISKNLYENNRIVSSVCHGYCGLLDVKLSNGEYLLQGKIITGFSWFEEVLAKVSKQVPYNAEEESKKRGAIYKKNVIPFTPRVEADGLLVTGQNPASAAKTAKKVAELLVERSA